jgi:hypothetical protein
VSREWTPLKKKKKKKGEGAKAGMAGTVPNAHAEKLRKGE